MSAVQINFAGEEELRELPGVGARVGTQVDDPVFYPLPVRTTDLHRAILEDRRLNQMTFWSRYDTVTQPRGNTDHWTKLKQRAVQHRSLSNPDAIGKPITLDGKHRRLPHGLVPRMSEKTFDDFIVDALQGNMPGTYMYTRPRNVPNKGALQNCFSDRARDGFRYWLIERPKPTNFGKYGIGSFKTVLGVGNAPRT